MCKYINSFVFNYPLQLDIKNPESMLKATKKGKGVMMFVDLQSNVSEEQADVMTRIWQTGLQNNHITMERYSIVASKICSGTLKAFQDRRLVKLFEMFVVQISN